MDNIFCPVGHLFLNQSCRFCPDPIPISHIKIIPNLTIFYDWLLIFFTPFYRQGLHNAYNLGSKDTWFIK